MNVELVHDPLAVLFHGLDAQTQLTGDLLISEALGNELKDLPLRAR